MPRTFYSYAHTTHNGTLDTLAYTAHARTSISQALACFSYYLACFMPGTPVASLWSNIWQTSCPSQSCCVSETARKRVAVSSSILAFSRHNFWTEVSFETPRVKNPMRNPWVSLVARVNVRWSNQTDEHTHKTTTHGRWGLKIPASKKCYGLISSYSMSTCIPGAMQNIALGKEVHKRTTDKNKLRLRGKRYRQVC